LGVSRIKTTLIDFHLYKFSYFIQINPYCRITAATRNYMTPFTSSQLL
jgi:hypothetical protein